ncbi:MAG: hypothetical protein AABW51_00115 [Nanoarchaeota archaeon]
MALNEKCTMDNPEKLRWYNLTIPLLGPILYMDRNSPPNDFKIVKRGLTSVITSTGLFGLVSAGIYYWNK